ncbi:hypothetical protein [Rufibacter hautae]|uniref:Uncharacterized protein n=1 Tax=Rufibacter hautae TaxID=2595005 RepID=A0A5B6TA33_9BACT|nr:hypothetical protein [Rufibacter hautae]KAA3436420.1 hypothetical protein FOA19_18680 [Rufibacter hautae]
MPSSPSEDFQWLQPLQDSTLLLVTTNARMRNQVEHFLVTKLNHDLQTVWQMKFEQPIFSSLVQVGSESNFIYLLFGVRDSPSLFLYTLDATTGKTWLTLHDLPNEDLPLTGRNVTKMTVNQGMILLSTLENGTSMVLRLNPAEKEIQLLPAVYGFQEQLIDFKVDPFTKATEAAVTESVLYNPRLQLKRFTFEGQILDNRFLPSGKNNSLQQVLIAPGAPENKLVFGTYGFQNNLHSQGFFSANLAGEFQFFSLGQLQHFFAYDHTAKTRKMERKYRHRIEKEKPVPATSQVLLHPILAHPQGFVVVGEVYSSKYTQLPYLPESTSYYQGGVIDGVFKTSSPGLPLAKNNSGLYVSYHFRSAVVLLFDREGNLLWDNSYAINKHTALLQPNVKATVTSSGEVLLAAFNTGTLHYRSFTANGTISSKEPIALQDTNKLKKQPSDTPEGLVKWYGSHFVAYNFERAKNENGKSHTIFTLQKFSF